MAPAPGGQYDSDESASRPKSRRSSAVFSDEEDDKRSARTEESVSSYGPDRPRKKSKPDANGPEVKHFPAVLSSALAKFQYRRSIYDDDEDERVLSVNEMKERQFSGKRKNALKAAALATVSQNAATKRSGAAMQYQC